MPQVLSARKFSSHLARAHAMYQTSARQRKSTLATGMQISVTHAMPKIVCRCPQHRSCCKSGPASNPPISSYASLYILSRCMSCDNLSGTFFIRKVVGCLVSMLLEIGRGRMTVQHAVVSGPTRHCLDSKCLLLFTRP